MSVVPGFAWRRRATNSLTLWAGSCPPSPGFAPCASFIWMSFAERRYSIVTPKRPDATCFIALFLSVPNRSGFSPPSPLFDMVPSPFRASAIVSCASGESEPSDIAPPTKCLTMESTGSTNVAIVELLPVPMLPVPNWPLELAIGNTFTLATLANSSCDLSVTRLFWSMSSV